MYDVIVVGGGIVGLSVARELAGRKSVLLLDRGPTGEGTSRAAAGMLSPLSEAGDQGPFFQLCRASQALYDRFVDDLQKETGVDCGYARSGLLVLASTPESAETLQERYEWQRRAGFEVEMICGDDVRQLEPQVTAPVSAALHILGEQSVTPRRLVEAVRQACIRRGVEIRTGADVESVSAHRVRLKQSSLDAGFVIIASGVWSAAVRGLDPPIPVFPRKGQILSLGMPPGAFRRMIRWQHSYLVPRLSGEIVVGATNEDAGFDLSLTAAGVGRLLADAQTIAAGLGSYPILETWAGLRPATPDGLPIVGPSALPGVIYATGHYRNGVLLAPITASIVADLVAGREPEVAIQSYAPSRFAKL